MTTLCGDKSHPLYVNKVNDMVTSWQVPSTEVLNINGLFIHSLYHSNIGYSLQESQQSQTLEILRMVEHSGEDYKKVSI